MLNFKLFAYLFHQMTIQISSIICNNSFWNTETTDGVRVNKVYYCFLGNCFQCNSFHPFGEVINRNHFGSISPMTSIPQATKGQGADIGYKSKGGE